MDQSARGRVKLAQVSLLTAPCGSEDRTNVLCEHFAKFNTPLIEAVNSVEESFSCDPMLVKRKELAT